MVNKVAGDLNYTNGTRPGLPGGRIGGPRGRRRVNNCQIPGQIWVRTDFVQSDGTHPSGLGTTEVGNNLMSFYLSSPYSPWFRAQ